MVRHAADSGDEEELPHKVIYTIKFKSILSINYSTKKINQRVYIITLKGCL